MGPCLGKFLKDAQKRTKLEKAMGMRGVSVDYGHSPSLFHSVVAPHFTEKALRMVRLVSFI